MMTKRQFRYLLAIPFVLTLATARPQRGGPGPGGPGAGPAGARGLPRKPNRKEKSTPALTDALKGGDGSSRHVIVRAKPGKKDDSIQSLTNAGYEVEDEMDLINAVSGDPAAEGAVKDVAKSNLSDSESLDALVAARPGRQLRQLTSVANAVRKRLPGSTVAGPHGQIGQRRWNHGRRDRLGYSAWGRFRAGRRSDQGVLRLHAGRDQDRAVRRFRPRHRGRRNHRRRGETRRSRRGDGRE